MSRAQLLAMARHNLAHAKAGTIDQAPEIKQVPAESYFDAARWERERDRIFRRMPLMLAMSCELAEPGDWRAMSVIDVPVLLSRGSDGEMRAFVNMCSHRGAQIMPQGGGNAHRFTCPYHAWTYNREGELVGILAREQFGELDRACHGLVRLPVHERAGMIWVTLDPDSPLDFDAFMSGYDELLGHFGFENWTLFSRRELAGPNWKVAYDGYLDLYHLPILHKNSFGSNMPNQALYYAWGPHQRVSSPDPNLLELEGEDEAEWPSEALLNGVWTIFPHVSIASFDGGGGRAVMVSQLFPGDAPGESVTVQSYVMENAPSEEQREKATAQFDFLEHVVRDEDYATGLAQQQALRSGMKPYVMFGRNEGGGQRFHGWVDRLLETPDEQLNSLFRDAEVVAPTAG